MSTTSVQELLAIKKLNRLRLENLKADSQTEINYIIRLDKLMTKLLEERGEINTKPIKSEEKQYETGLLDSEFAKFNSIEEDVNKFEVKSLKERIEKSV